MLAPRDRTLLLDALRPPDGYRLDEGIGTTFSLDLVALLTVPVGFTSFELQESDGGRIGAADELVLLKTIREYADRISIFCQAGRIAVPAGYHLLLTTFESSVIEVAAPDGSGVFHPKVWVLRYVPDGALEETVRYRVLVLSRNLTFAQSWDTMLALDGELTDRRLAIAANHPLADFVAALPRLAVRGAPAEAAARAARLADELRRVRFELPAGIDDLAFHPLGVAGYRQWPFAGRVDRMLVVSPFLSAGCLKQLALPKGEHVLVSRIEALDTFGVDQLAPFAQLFALDPDADLAGDASEEGVEGGADADGGACPEPPAAGAVELRGLHAKLYVADAGWDARIWTGSANATSAAFARNVEFLAELRGKKSQFGVQVLLGGDNGEVRFRDLLVPYEPSAKPSLPTVEEQMEDQLDAVRYALAARGWRARIAPAAGGTGYDVVLAPSGPVLHDMPSEVDALHARPVSLGEAFDRVPAPGTLEFRFESLSLEALTGFFAVTVRVRHAGQTAVGTLVVNAALEGLPEGRAEAVLRALLRNRRQVLQFLLLLLADDPDLVAGGGVHVVPGPLTGAGAQAESQAEALLEPLLRALYRDPSRLEQVARVVADLRGAASESGDSLLPESFDTVFRPIWRAREAMR